MRTSLIGSPGSGTTTTSPEASASVSASATAPPPANSGTPRLIALIGGFLFVFIVLSAGSLYAIRYWRKREAKKDQEFRGISSTSKSSRKGSLGLLEEGKSGDSAPAPFNTELSDFTAKPRTPIASPTLNVRGRPVTSVQVVVDAPAQTRAVGPLVINNPSSASSRPSPVMGELSSTAEDADVAISISVVRPSDTIPKKVLARQATIRHRMTIIQERIDRVERTAINQVPNDTKTSGGLLSVRESPQAQSTHMASLPEYKLLASPNSAPQLDLPGNAYHTQQELAALRKEIERLNALLTSPWASEGSNQLPPGYSEFE